MRRPARVAWLGVVAIAAASAVGLAIPAAQAATNTHHRTRVSRPGTCPAGRATPADSAVTGHAHTGTYALAGAASNSSNAAVHPDRRGRARTPSYTLTA